MREGLKGKNSTYFIRYLLFFASGLIPLFITGIYGSGIYLTIGILATAVIIVFQMLEAPDTQKDKNSEDSEDSSEEAEDSDSGFAVVRREAREAGIAVVKGYMAAELFSSRGLLSYGLTPEIISVLLVVGLAIFIAIFLLAMLLSARTVRIIRKELLSLLRDTAELAESQEMNEPRCYAAFTSYIELIAAINIAFVLLVTFPEIETSIIAIVILAAIIVSIFAYAARQVYDYMDSDFNRTKAKVYNWKTVILCAATLIIPLGYWLIFDYAQLQITYMIVSLITTVSLIANGILLKKGIEMHRSLLYKSGFYIYNIFVSLLLVLGAVTAAFSYMPISYIIRVLAVILLMIPLSLSALTFLLRGKGASEINLKVNVRVEFMLLLVASIIALVVIILNWVISGFSTIDIIYFIGCVYTAFSALVELCLPTIKKRGGI